MLEPVFEDTEVSADAVDGRNVWTSDGMRALLQATNQTSVTHSFCPEGDFVGIDRTASFRHVAFLFSSPLIFVSA